MDISARYNDGRTAASHAVRLRLHPPHLIVLAEDGAELDRWPLATLHLVHKPDPGQPARLASGGDGDARLSLPDSKALETLVPWCPRLKRGAVLALGEWKAIAIWGCAAVLSLVLLFGWIIPFGASRLAAMVPDSFEQGLGEQVETAVLQLLSAAEKREAKLCADPAADAALEKLAGRLATGLEVPVRVGIVRAKMINALALPGGRVLLLDGLLRFTETPDELAAVLAHEMGHLIRRHPTERLFRETASSALIGLLLGDVAGGTVLAAAGRLMLSAAYTREAEEEADALGLDLMAKAGLDPAAAAAFFRRLEAKEAEKGLSGLPAFLSTHPPTPARAAAAASRAHRGTAPALTAAEWEAVRNACR